MLTQQVSLRQQVRDLETQLDQLKSYQREQATKLGTVVADKEALQIERAQLLGGTIWHLSLCPRKHLCFVTVLTIHENKCCVLV
jgi:hypothetical protein